MTHIDDPGDAAVVCYLRHLYRESLHHAAARLTILAAIEGIAAGEHWTDEGYPAYDHHGDPTR